MTVKPLNRQFNYTQPPVIGGLRRSAEKMKYLNPEEIRKLKEGGYDSVLLAARSNSERWEAANSLREKIEAAFAGVTLGDGIGLKEGDGIDDYADADVLAQLHTQDERSDWHRLTSDDLLSHQFSITFMDAEGLRFHLPAWMLAELRDLSLIHI